MAGEFKVLLRHDTRKGHLTHMKTTDAWQRVEVARSNDRQNLVLKTHYLIERYSGIFIPKQLKKRINEVHELFLSLIH